MDILTESQIATIKKAAEIFDALDDFGKGELFRCGTAFTTYEDHGPAVCKALNDLARAWHAAKWVQRGG